MKSLTIKDMMDLDSFDPFSIDMSEFKELSDSMPRDMNLDLAIAEKLASQYLRAADRISEILSTLTYCYESAKTNKDKIRAKLFLISKSEGYTTVAERGAYVESHDDYLKAAEFLSRVDAVKTLFKLKHENFLNSHRLMKDKLKSEQKHLQLSGFSETRGSDVEMFGEKDWE